MAQSKYPKPIDEKPTDNKPSLPKKKVMTVVMDDGTVHSANIGRPGVRRMFAAAHDGRDPDGELDAYWMFWHAIGRPGNTGNDLADLADFIDAVQAEDISEVEVDNASTPTSQG